MLYADSFRCRLVFDTLHGFDGMFFFLTVSLSWNDTDGIGVYKFRSKDQIASRGYCDAFLKWIDASVSVGRGHLQKQLSKR
jgi:hypothetical protein